MFYTTHSEGNVGISVGGNIGLAMFLMEEGEQEQAPKLLAELENELPIDVVTNAQEQGKALNLWENCGRVVGSFRKNWCNGSELVAERRKENLLNVSSTLIFSGGGFLRSTHSPLHPPHTKVGQSRRNRQRQRSPLVFGQRCFRNLALPLRQSGA